jgi:hypothetical protein
MLLPPVPIRYTEATPEGLFGRGIDDAQAIDHWKKDNIRGAKAASK